MVTISLCQTERVSAASQSVNEAVLGHSLGANLLVKVSKEGLIHRLLPLHKYDWTSDVRATRNTDGSKAKYSYEP